MTPLLLTACLTADLPDGALARVGSPTLRHPGAIDRAAYSGDGELIAAAGKLSHGVYLLRVWRADDGARVRDFRIASVKPPALAFVPGGRAVLTARNVIERQQWTLVVERLYLDGKRETWLTKPWSSGSSARFVGTRLVFSERRKWRFIDVVSEQVVKTDRGLLCVGPKGKSALFEGGVVLSLASGKPRFTIPAPSRGLAYSFSADGRLLVENQVLWPYTARNKPRVWEVATGKMLPPVDKPGVVAPLAGGLLAQLRGGQIELLSADGRAVRRLEVPRPIDTLAPSRDGSVLLGWESHSNQAPSRIAWRIPDGEPIGGWSMGKPLAVRPGGADWLFSQPGGRALRVMDLKSGKGRLPGGPIDDATSVRFAGESRIAVSSRDTGHTIVVEWKTGRVIERYGDQLGSVKLLAEPASHGAAAVFARSWGAKSIQVIDLSGVKPRERLVPNWHPAIAKDGPIVKRVIVGDGRLFSVSLWKARRRWPHRGLPDYYYGPTRLAQWIESPAEGRKPHHAEIYRCPDPHAVLIPSPRGRYVAELSQRGRWLIGLQTGERRRLGERRFSASPSSAMFTPDGRLFLSSEPADGELSVAVFETATGSEACEPIRLSRQAGLACSPDGRGVAHFARGGTVALRDLATGRVRKTFHGHETPGGVAFSPSGRLLATLTPTAPVFIWPVPDPPNGRRLKTTDLDEIWEAMADPDPKVAFTAMAQLADDPQRGVPFLAERLVNEPKIDAAHVRRLIDRLGAADAARRAAAAALARMRSAAVEESLRAALKGAAPRAARQIRRLLNTGPASSGRLRTTRAVQTLEWVGGPAGLKGLRRVDTQDAAAAVARIEARMGET